MVKVREYDLQAEEREAERMELEADVIEALADLLATAQRINTRLDEIQKQTDDNAKLLRSLLRTRAVICGEE